MLLTGQVFEFGHTCVRDIGVGIIHDGRGLEHFLVVGFVSELE